MSIAKANTLGRHPVDPRRLVLGLGVVAREIAIAEVVGIDDENVGKLTARFVGRRNRREKQ